MIGQILSSVVGLGTSYLDSKSQIQKAKAVKEQKIAEGTASWEVMAMDASKSSIKDEIWTGLFVILILANFLPFWGIQEHMARGWEILKNADPMFWIIISIIVSASMGVTGINKIFKKK